MYCQFVLEMPHPCNVLFFFFFIIIIIILIIIFVPCLNYVIEYLVLEKGTGGPLCMFFFSPPPVPSTGK